MLLNLLFIVNFIILNIIFIFLLTIVHGLSIRSILIFSQIFVQPSELPLNHLIICEIPHQEEHKTQSLN